MRKRSLFGLLVIAVGVIILLGRLDIIDTSNIFGTYWPLILIGIALVNLFDKHGSKMLASILLIVGVIFQLKELDIEILEGVRLVEFIFPSIIILVGIWLIIPKTLRSIRGNTTSLSSIDNITLFSGSNIINDSTDFSGGNLIAAFGGIDVDLRNADIISSEPVVIDVIAAFGGIDIKVPADWKVEIKGIPLFGGWSNKTDRSNRSTNKVLIVKCFVMFGGLDVKL